MYGIDVKIKQKFVIYSKTWELYILPQTVNSAFTHFMKHEINLDPDKVKTARSSRNFLQNQIKGFDEFLPLYSEKDISFGSFARRTKIRELDDIDMIFVLKARDCRWSEDLDGTVYMHTPEDSKEYKNYRHSDSLKLNSRKILGKFLSSLKGIHHYRQAAIHRNLHAATLKLTSYDWNFDIVPAFFTAEDSLGRSYYIIPNGTGDWMKTDPRIDQKRVSQINSDNNGNLLNLIRLVKYWQRRRTMPLMPSYLLENLVLKYADENALNEFIDLRFKDFLLFLANNIHHSVYDPKGIQGDLNTLSYEDKVKINNKAATDYATASEAFSLEVTDNNHEAAIREWKKIFGAYFPNYE